MSNPISPAILDTVLSHLAAHFLGAANGDLPTARHAASCMLAAHDPQPEEELALATDIVGFGFHALEALSASAADDLSLNQKIRLRGSAVSLNRQAHKARRQLDQLRQVRQAAISQPQPEPASTEDQPATDLIERAQKTVQAIAGQGSLKDWTMSRQQRRAADRIAETLRRNAAEHQRKQRAAVVAPVPPQTHTVPARTA